MRFRLCLGSIILAMFALAGPAPGQPERARPPVAKKVAKLTELHGETLTDDYYWLRQKKDPEVIKYLDAENAYTAAVMQPTEPLQEKLYQEFLARIKQTDLSVPTREGGYWYYTRTEQGKQYPIHCRKKGSLEGEEQVLLDVNELAKGHKFYSVAARVVSDDGDRLAYTNDVTGFREYALRIKDLRTGETLADQLVKVGAVVWAADNQTLFYVTEDHAKRPYRLWRHRIGDPQEKDTLLFEEKDELYRVGISHSRDRKYLFLTIGSFTASEVHYLTRDEPLGKFTVLMPREEGHRYTVEHRGGTFYIRTNKDAKNFRLVTCPAAKPNRKNWQELISHRPEVMLERVDVFAGHLVLGEREGGLQRLVIFDPATKQRTPVAFDEPSYALFGSANPEFDSALYRFAYTSFTTPQSVFDYDVATGTRKLLKQTEVLGGYDPKQYHTERTWAVAKDGVKVPISVVYRKGIKLDGRAPLLLYGYGAYGASNPAAFNEPRLSLLDRGVIYAIAHVRGGGEMGEPWHDGGKMMNKRNSFTDFIACAEHLIDQKYTSRDRLAIQGGSAGGLLMGGVLAMRPDLPRVAVLEVPFVDVINTMLDESLPLTVPEFLEWGNPRELTHFTYMKSYCPYSNLKTGRYPAMLVRTSLNDSQVMYWEPAKYVAKLRPLKQDDNVLVFKCNMEAGHGGASGRYDALRERAFVFAFVLTQLGVEK
jgi:oligopeptidase B